MLTSNYFTPTWPAPKNVRAYMTTRGKNASFNLAQHVDDDFKRVAQNRLQLSQALKLPTDPHWLKQVHGKTIVELPSDEVVADASLTKNDNHVCVVLTADCLPVLFCNQAGTKVAACHAGWRGLYQGILSQTISALQEPAESLIVYFGPAISQKHYQVSEDLRTQFLKLNPGCEVAFLKQKNNWYCDLYALARLELTQQGIRAIYGGEHCTYAEDDLFFSYRREGAQAGRMASLIWMESSSASD